VNQTFPSGPAVIPGANVRLASASRPTNETVEGADVDTRRGREDARKL
jgi:hypothetical protein